MEDPARRRRPTEAARAHRARYHPRVRLETRLDPESSTFRANTARMTQLVGRVRDLEARVRARSAAAAAKFHARSQLLPRERLERLLDPGTPFLELSSLAGLGMHGDDGADSITGGGLIAGIGLVRDVRVLVLVHDAAIKGGAITPMGLRKSLRAQTIALENRLPIVTLAESAGADLLHQSELFVDGGRVFANQARLSAAGIPQVTIVHGSSTAGGAYLPGLSDIVVMVRGRAKVFLGGPPLVRAAIGEVASDEELGGAELHASVTGTAEYVAEDDAHGVALAREIVDRLGWPRSGSRKDAASPRHDAEELLGLVPVDDREPWAVAELVARLVDDSEALVFKAGYGSATWCAQARIEGHDCGILANDGPIDPDGATKATQFIQLCSRAGTPLVYLQNTTGYMVGTQAERAGMVKHGSKMIQAVANAAVPQITMLVGGSYGAGNYGMCGRAFDPRFLFAWPNARIAVMGGEQAAGVMEMVTVAKMRRRGLDPDPEVLRRQREGILGRFEEESSALFATARLWDDGIVDPRDSRRILGMCLSLCAEARRHEPRPVSFGVARP